jgi:peptide-O-fucosyltransferase
VHWRRRDFLHGHQKELPSIEGTAQQLERICKRLKLHTVFIATDAPDNGCYYQTMCLNSTVAEVEQLRRVLPDTITLSQYRPTVAMINKYKDGGVSIVDQWICAHARYRG